MEEFRRTKHVHALSFADLSPDPCTGSLNIKPGHMQQVDRVGDTRWNEWQVCLATLVSPIFSQIRGLHYLATSWALNLFMGEKAFPTSRRSHSRFGRGLLQGLFQRIVPAHISSRLVMAKGIQRSDPLDSVGAKLHQLSLPKLGVAAPGSQEFVELVDVDWKGCAV